MFQLNWSILKILSFEPLCDLLMTFYILHCISFIMLRMSHAYFYSSFSSIGAFWKFEFWTPLDPLMAFYNIAFCFIMVRPWGFSFFLRGVVATPPNTEGHITLNLLPVYIASFEKWPFCVFHRYSCFLQNMLRKCQFNLHTNLWVHITSNIFKISNSKIMGSHQPPWPPNFENTL